LGIGGRILKNEKEITQIAILMLPLLEKIEFGYSLIKHFSDIGFQL
jgi:hypothetical protein